MKVQPAQNQGGTGKGGQAHSSPTGTRRGRGGWMSAGIAAILLLGAYAFGPALSGGWVWDDDAEIVRNELIKDPAALGRIWCGATTDYFPLKTTFQWLQWHAWGDHPFPYHATNIALHLLSALLVWRLLGKLGCAPAAAWLAGLLFAVHPLTVESVAWIAEFKNAVSLPPLLLAAICFIGYFDSGRRRDHALALCWFLVATLCKSSVVMLPLVLLVFAWWRRGRVTMRTARAVAPFFAISAVLGVVTIWFQQVRAIAHWEIAAGGGLERLGRAGAAMVFYLGKCIAPVGLLPVYPRDVPPGSAVAQMLAWIAIAGIIIWCWRRRNTWGRHALLATAWFGLNLAPVLGIVTMAFLHFAWVADHFAYIPLIGVIGFAASGCGMAWTRWQSARTSLAAAGALVVGLAVFATRQHVARFASEETLWRYTLAHNPAAWVGHNNLAVALARQHKPAEAAEHAAMAVQLKPDYGEAYANRAGYLAQLGRFDEALATVAQAEAHGAATADLYSAAAAMVLRAGRVADAIAYYEHALRLDPSPPKLHKDFGVALFFAGRNAEAVEHYERGLATAPDPETHANCGVALMALDRVSEALRHYDAALLLAPASVDAHFNRGIALARIGQFPAAQDEFEETVRLNPNHAEAYSNLGAVLLRRGRNADAATAFRAALRLKPGLEEARLGLQRTGRAEAEP